MSTTNSKLSIPVIQPSILRFSISLFAFSPGLEKVTTVVLLEQSLLSRTTAQSNNYPPARKER